MDQNPTLQKLLLNIIYEVTAPNKTDKLEAYQMIAILALTNLLGIVNMMSHYAPRSEHLPAMSPSSGSEGELLNNLISLLGSKKGGSLPDINPQTLMTIMSVLSSLGNKNKSDSADAHEPLRENSM